MKKETYIQPEIDSVELDTTISLQLASDVDPMSEPEDWTQVKGNFDNDPLQLL